MATHLVAPIALCAVTLALGARVVMVRRERARVAASIAARDPASSDADADFVMREAFLRDMPFETATGAVLAGGPGFLAMLVAKAFLQTGKLRRTPVLRADETFRPIFAMVAGGIGSEDFRAAARKINHIHSFYRPEVLFRDEDVVFVAAAFLTTTLRFADTFGWRPLTPVEREAIYRTWRRIGEACMLSNASAFPESLAATEAWFDERVARTEANEFSPKVLFEFLEYVWTCGWVPPWIAARLRPHAGALVAGLIPFSPRTVELMGLTPAPRWYALLLRAFFAARGVVMRNLVMPAARAWDPNTDGIYPWLFRGWPSYQPHTDRPLPAVDGFAPEYDARKSPLTGCPFKHAAAAHDASAEKVAS